MPLKLAKNGRDHSKPDAGASARNETLIWWRWSGSLFRNLFLPESGTNVRYVCSSGGLIEAF